MFVFENGQFSGHLIFNKKTFFSEKKFVFTPINKNFVLFEKKCFFEQIIKKILTNFLWAEKFWKYWKENFRKNIFFQKKEHVFFSNKTKFLFIRVKTNFFSEKKVFLLKIKCGEKNFFWSWKIEFLEKKIHIKINLFFPKTLFFTTKKKIFVRKLHDFPHFLTNLRERGNSQREGGEKQETTNDQNNVVLGYPETLNFHI